jgi:hypothetical protein
MLKLPSVITLVQARLVKAQMIPNYSYRPGRHILRCEVFVTSLMLSPSNPEI